MTVVERGGKMRERARLGVQVHVCRPCGWNATAAARETIYREGDPPGRERSEDRWWAIGGAIIGHSGWRKGCGDGGSIGAVRARPL